MRKPDKSFYETTASNGTFMGIWAPEKENHAALQAIFDLLKNRGWDIQTDQGVLERYPLIADDFFEGQKGGLRFKAEQHPACSKLEFYQEINIKNRNGGQHDFDKLLMMPYLIRCQFLTELKHIKNILIGLCYVDHSDPVLKTAEEKVKYDFVTSWHHPQKTMDFNLKDLNGQTSEIYNSTDKYGKTIRNGDIKYFRDCKGRLMRGTVYHNINNMWWVLINKYWRRNLANFELFDLSEKDSAKKTVKRSGHHNPKSRWVPAPEELKKWRANAKAKGREGRLGDVNKFLKYLYSIDWISRCFQFVLKENGRLELVEPEGRPNFSVFGIPRKRKVFDPPRKIPLYPVPKQMSYTESSWIKSLREYIIHGPGPRVSTWFCRDNNGEGCQAYLWPVIRERLIKMGAMLSASKKIQDKGMEKYAREI